MSVAFPKRQFLAVVPFLVAAFALAAEVPLDSKDAAGTDSAPGLTATGWLDLGDQVGVVWSTQKPVDEVQIDSGSANKQKAAGTAGLALLPRTAIAGDTMTLQPVTNGRKGPASQVKIAPAKPQTSAAVTIAGAARETTISPYLFGSNTFQVGYNPKWSQDLATAGITVARWGGNHTSTYNWHDDAVSAGNDWFYHISDYGPIKSVRDTFWCKFVRDFRRDGIDVLYTVPIGDWVSRRPAPGEDLCVFPKSLYPNQQKFDGDGHGWGNGKTADGKKIIDFDVLRTNIPNSVEFQREWLKAAVKEFGPADKGGIKFIGLDNEIGLWFDSHRDTQPVGMSSAELWKRNLEYATAFKQVDPAVQVFGLASWGMMDLAGSDVDWERGATASGKKGKWAEKNEVRGGMDQLSWYLEQAKAAEVKAGKRVIDGLTLNMYPQVRYEVNGRKIGPTDMDIDYDPVITPLQFDALRHWYDPTYENPKTWMNDSAENTAILWKPYNPYLPKIQEAIAKHYPGTKVAITEWRTGSDDRFPGALLHAELVGRMMENELFMSCHWYGVGPDAWGHWGHALFGNTDGKRNAIAGHVQPVASSDKDLTAFAAVDGKRHCYVLVNRDYDHGVKVALPATAGATWHLTCIAQTAGKRLVHLPSQTAGGPTIEVSLPPFSAAVCTVEEN